MDVFLVLLVAAFVRYFSGAEEFTFLHTPDSEFYLSLAAFGDQVTDRAPFDSYFWTKLGVLLPVRLLTELMGVNAAILAWHFVLTLVIAASAYGVARPCMSRLGAVNAALFLTTSTVILGHVADPYFSGPALAGLSLVILLGHKLLFSAARQSTVFFVGLVLGWLVMINPFALFVAGCVLFGLSLPHANRIRRVGLLRLELAAINVLAGFTVSFLLFLLAGTFQFPGLRWLPTVLGFLGSVDLSAWSEDSANWLLTETSLLVPLAAIIVTVGVHRSRGGHPAGLSASAAGMATVPVLLVTAYKLWSDAAVLETSYYNSLLFPSALLGIVVAVSSAVDRARMRGVPTVILVLTTTGWIAAGHWSTVIEPAFGLVLVLAASALSITVLRRKTLREPVAILLVLGSLGVAFQVVQNGRPGRSETIARQDYSSAFRANSTADEVRRNLDFESWVLESTQDTDRILVWARRESLSPAAMQLWGPNALYTDDPNGEGRLLSKFPRADPPALHANVIVSLAGSRAEAAETSRRMSVQLGSGPALCKVFEANSLVPPGLWACIHRLAPGPFE